MDHLSNRSPGGFHVPDSLRYHTIEVFFAHMEEACPEPTSISTDVFSQIFEPFLSLLRQSSNEHVVNHVLTDVLEIYAKDKGILLNL